MVSIIVPVYNVCDYIDRCMESLIEQTYKNIEIILINDGSTDGSNKKCEEWANRDKRIIYISKENEGLGPTRNLGIATSKSDYVMFVDSDDWVDKAIVEKLLNKLISTESDIVTCDRYDVKLKSDTYTLVVQDIDEETELKKKPMVISKISTAQCGKIFKKSLYIESGMELPKHFYEDAVTPVLIAMSKRVCYVKEPLYYYVVDRSESITNNVGGLDQMMNYLETLVELFKKYNLFDRYRDYIWELCEKRIGWNLYHADCVLTNKRKEIYEQNVAFVKKYWDEEYEMNKLQEVQCLEEQFLVWGSYNLITAMKIIMSLKTARCPQNHYAFSSVISAMSKRNLNLNQIVIEHKNEFRKENIIKEIKREFLHKNLGEFSKIEYLVIDLLEERFDIGEYKGEYFTISDAVKELKEFEELEYTQHSRIGQKVLQLWKKRCNEYIDLIRKFFGNKRIILVKMFLAEEYGSLETRKKYVNNEDIKKINKCLEFYYDYFVKQCPEAEVIEVVNSEYYFTDESYRHGCYPWHLNEYMYREIKEKIVETVWGK